MTPAEEVAYFERTAHCGRCGQPGRFCLCTGRCGCGDAGLHERGSGLRPDALEAFAETVTVPDEQEGLF